MYTSLAVLLLLALNYGLLKWLAPSLFVFLRLYRHGWRRTKWGKTWFLTKKFGSLTYNANNLQSALEAEKLYGNNNP